MRADYVRGRVGKLRQHRPRSNRRPFTAEWHSRTPAERALGRAIQRSALPIPLHKQEAMSSFMAAGGTGPGNRSLASIWKEWR